MIAVRAERPNDAGGIRAVHAASFPGAGEARLVDALRAGGRLSLSLVALDEDRVVGHAAFSPVSLGNAEDGLGLGPLAVLPAFRRRGIAARLVREGLAACEGTGAGFVVVLGDPAYYARFGFRPAAPRGLRDEYGGGEAFQVLELRAGTLPPEGGLVRYAPEFAAVEGGG